MKEVGILTMHRPLNFGCTLQTFATQFIIEQLGYHPTVIDYLYPAASNSVKYNIKRRIFQLGNLLISFLFTGTDFLRRKKRYADFLSQNIKLTKSYKTAESLKMDCPKCDVFCMGSDQIWNPNFIGGDLSFLGSFVPGDKKVFSYASSFGISELSDEQARIYGNCLRRFTGVFVRERQGQVILANQIGLNAERVLDPTLLLNAAEWQRLTSPISVKRPYILCYGVESDGLSLVDKAEQLIQNLPKANDEQYRIVHIHGRPWQRLSPKAHYTFDTGPCEFLSLVKNASCVLTTSYHGTCFSINFGIPFWSFVRKDSVDTRIPDLLELLNLAKRVKHYSDSLCEIGELGVEYNKLIESERIKSVACLQRILKACFNE